jgi:MFS family permease
VKGRPAEAPAPEPGRPHPPESGGSAEAPDSGSPAEPAAPRTPGTADPAAPPLTLRSIALAAFLPPALFSVSQGAIAPVMVITATNLGASAAVAAMIVALAGLGQILADIPAGALTARYGERPVMIGAGLFSAVALGACWLAPSLAIFGVAILVTGMGAAVWMLARLTFVAERVPFELRARAMSTLGGVQRIGLFLGPFLGAGVVHLFGPQSAYLVALGAVLVATVVLFFVPDPPSPDRIAAGRPRQRYLPVLTAERRTFTTVGIAIFLVSMVRATRQVVLPLWGAHIGLAPATIALVFGLSGAVDMLLFYPAGRLMDLRGRAWVAVPSMLGLALGLVLMPATGTAVALAGVGLIMGVGNGMGSGMVMTLGADLAPPDSRPVFFGIWRLVSDIGNGAGPVLLAGITAAATLAAGIFTMGGVGLLAAAGMGYWVPRVRRRA